MIQLLLFLLLLVLLFFISRSAQRYISRLLYGLTKSKKISAYLFALLFLPGTYIHEFSHILVSLMLLVPVGKLELMPKLEGEQLKLGSVSIGKTDFIRRFLIGIAPLFLGVFIVVTIVAFAFANPPGDIWWKYLIYLYLIFTISNTMFMSKRDMEGGWKLGMAFAFIFLLLYLVGFRATVTSESFLYSENFIHILSTTNKYLLFPLGLDLVIVLLAKISRD